MSVVVLFISTSRARCLWDKMFLFPRVSLLTREHESPDIRDLDLTVHCQLWAHPRPGWQMSHIWKGKMSLCTYDPTRLFQQGISCDLAYPNIIVDTAAEEMGMMNELDCQQYCKVLKVSLAHSPIVNFSGLELCCCRTHWSLFALDLATERFLFWGGLPLRPSVWLWG